MVASLYHDLLENIGDFFQFPAPPGAPDVAVCR
jgi:hypothetical protein